MFCLLSADLFCFVLFFFGRGGDRLYHAAPHAAGTAVPPFPFERVRVGVSPQSVVGGAGAVAQVKEWTGQRTGGGVAICVALFNLARWGAAVPDALLPPAYSSRGTRPPVEVVVVEAVAAVAVACLLYTSDAADE